MPRDWMREARGREDFGQADFSRDYAYDPDRRSGYRAADEDFQEDDYGQADYSTDYAFDPERGRAYRRFSDEDRRGTPAEADRAYGQRMDEGDYRRGSHTGERSRSWADRAGAFFSGREEGRAVRRRRGPSDRVLWAIIVERLEAARGLDLRDVEVFVEDAEVTLNGTVRRKEDKRRIEDIADLDEVRHVQNNLRVRDAGRRWFG